MILKTYLSFLSLISASICYFQAAPRHVPDSLIGKEYSFYISQLDRGGMGAATAKLYAKAYLFKAKSERNFEEQFYAYKNLLHLCQGVQRFAYGDSMIYAARQSLDKSLIGSGYLTKGILYYEQKHYQEALRHYLIANSYIAATDDAYLGHKISYNIAQLKYYLGKYGQALPLFQECVRFYEKEGGEAYVSSLHSLGMCYIRMKQYGLCTKINEIGVKESLRQGYSGMLPYFLHSEGINFYYQQHYTSAIKKLEQSIPGFVTQRDFANMTVADFYIGKSYMRLQNTKAALPYFMKVDTAFRKRHYVRPDLKESYDILIAHYKETGDTENEILYHNRLHDADSTLFANYRQLSGTLSSDYDTKKIVDENDGLKANSFRKNVLIFCFSVVVPLLLLVFSLLLYRNRRKQKHYRQLYEAFLQREEDGKLNNKRKRKNGTDDLSDISADVVTSVLHHLERFVATKKFLEKGMTQVKVAEYLHSNTAYVSRIIAYHEGEKFSDYMNRLRIDHVVHLLATDKLCRNYTYQALADMAGFATAQTFADEFKKRMGMPPRVFAENREKDEKSKG